MPLARLAEGMTRGEYGKALRRVKDQLRLEQGATGGQRVYRLPRNQPPAKDKRKIRPCEPSKRAGKTLIKCLGYCDHYFYSEGKHNRLCAHCKVLSRG